MSRVLDSFLDYYGNLSKNGVNRLNGARDKLGKGTYGLDQLTSDTVGFWFDVVDGWFDIALRPVSDSLPVATIMMAPTDPSPTSPEIRVTLTDKGKPVCTDLAGATGVIEHRIQPPPPGKTMADIGVVFGKNSDGSENRTLLTLQLSNFTQQPAVGLYQGLIFVNNTVLAQALVLVK